MTGPVADRLYLGEDLIYQRGEGPEPEPEIEVTPYSSPYALPARLVANSNSTASGTSVSVSPSQSGFGVAALHMRTNVAVTPPSGWTERARLQHPSSSELVLIVFTGPVTASAAHAFSWSGATSAVLRMNTFSNIAAYVDCEISASPALGNLTDFTTPNVEVDDSTGTVAVAVSAVNGAYNFTPGFPSTLLGTAWNWPGSNNMQLATGWFHPVEGVDWVEYPTIPIGTVAQSAISALVVLRAASGSRPAPSHTFPDAIGGLVEDMVGAAWQVLHDGEVIDSGEHGYTRTDADRYPKPYTQDTRVNVASISKLVTLVALMKLVEDEGVDLDAPVIDYLTPRWTSSSAASGVTVRNVAMMRDGRGSTAYDETQSLDAQVSYWLSTNPLTYPQGRVHSYSNQNYSVLTGLVEVVSGMEYRDYVNSILAPYLRVDTAPDGTAYPPMMYALDDSTTGTARAVATGGLGATGLWMSANDIAQLARILRSEDVLSAESISELWSLRPYAGERNRINARGTAMFPNGAWTESTDGLRAGLFRGPDGYDVIYTGNGPQTFAAGLLAALNNVE